MAKSQLEQVLKSIRRLQQSHSKDLRHIYNLNNEIEYGKSKILEYLILNKVKLLGKIKRKLRQLRLSRHRYQKKIKIFRKKLRNKLRIKQRVEEKLEKIRIQRARKRERLRKRLLLKRLVREERLMRLKQMAELRESDRKRYAIELKAEKRRKKLLKQRPKREHPALKRLKHKIGKTKKKGTLLVKTISSLRSSIEGFQKKVDILKKNTKSLNVKASHIEKELKNSGSVPKKKMKSSKISIRSQNISPDKSLGTLRKTRKSSTISIKSLSSNKLRKSQKKRMSRMSVGSLKSKKTVRLRSSKEAAIVERKSKASLSAASNKFVPLEALMGKKFPISILRRNKGKKEPKPIGDMGHSHRKRKSYHRQGGRKASTTSSTGNTTSTASESGRKSVHRKALAKRVRDKRKLHQGAGDISAEISSYMEDISSLYSNASTHVYKPKRGRSKQPTVNLDYLRKSLRKPKAKSRHIKGVLKPIDRDTLRSILLPDGSKEMFKMPRHSTSKPSYSEVIAPPSESETKPLVYNEKYYKNLVRTQSQSIRNLIKAERKLKRVQKQKELEEAERRAKEQREQESRKRRLSSNNNDKELERLVEEGLKSQFNLFDVIPDETPVINEDILKMAERGERINIRDLVPTSRIFELNMKLPSPVESTRSSISRKVSKPDKRIKKKQSSKRRRSSSVRGGKKKDTTHQDSNESDEELGSVVKVRKFWDFHEELRQQLPVAEEELEAFKEVLQEPKETKSCSLEVKKKKAFNGVTSNCQREQQIPVPKVKPEIIVVCSACNMTDMQPGGPCCKFKPKNTKDV